MPTGVEADAEDCLVSVDVTTEPLTLVVTMTTVLADCAWLDPADAGCELPAPLVLLP